MHSYIYGSSRNPPQIAKTSNVTQNSQGKDYVTSPASVYVGPRLRSTSFRWYILEIYRVGGGDCIPVWGNNRHARCPSGTDAGIEISVVCKVEEGSVIVDLLPKTFTERGVGHIYDNLKTRKKHQRKPLKSESLNETNSRIVNLVPRVFSLAWAPAPNQRKGPGNEGLELWVGERFHQIKRNTLVRWTKLFSNDILQQKTKTSLVTQIILWLS